MSTDLLHPLEHFHENGGWPLPSVDVIDGAAVPEPYRSLLVHDGDMTSRLELFHGGEMSLEVLHREEGAAVYRREVLLRVASSRLAVEYGAIEIHLAAFDPQIQKHILAGQTPLGGLLNHFGINYRSQPRAFLRLAPDERMSALFDVSGAQPLYGRSNVLLGEGVQVLAQIVEVLRPVEGQ